MTSFAESQGLEPFDWNRYLARAEHGEISERQAEEAVDLSYDWPLCACGNLCASIPRDENGMPIDAELAMHGGTFPIPVIAIADARQRNDLDGMRVHAGKAIDIMRQIEQRAAVLLSEQSK